MTRALPILIACLPVALAAAPIEVVLKKEVQVESAKVLLGDVASISGDSRLVARAQSIVVARSPRAGQEERIGAEALRHAVRIAFVPEMGDAHWIGEGVRITRASQEVSGDRLAEVARAYLAAELGARAREVQVKPALNVSDVRIARGEVAATARGAPERGVGARRQVVWVDITVDGEPERSVPVTLAVESRPMVARGETVTLRAATGAVAVEAEVVALDDGNSGERVWIRRNSSGEALRAEVAGPGLVMVGER